MQYVFILLIGLRMNIYKLVMLVCFFALVVIYIAAKATDVKADDTQSDRIVYLERWVKAEALLLTQPDYNPSKRHLRRKLLKILNGSWRGYGC